MITYNIQFAVAKDHFLIPCEYKQIISLLFLYNHKICNIHAGKHVRHFVRQQNVGRCRLLFNISGLYIQLL
jgi:hypothetical protein